MQLNLSAAEIHLAEGVVELDSPEIREVLPAIRGNAPHHSDLYAALQTNVAFGPVLRLFPDDLFRSKLKNENQLW